MSDVFELEWMGGAAEHHFRKARPGIDDLPWGTLDTSAYPPEVVGAARATWTESTFTEYKAVAAFSEVLRALCEARAPLDLVGMASSFVADEVFHVELASRMTMELGGAAPRRVDFESLVIRAEPSLTAFERANEVMLRVSCIAEAFSGKMAAGVMRTTTHPLTRAVLERIVADESLHHRLGGLYFEWASERMSDAERARLGRILLRTLRAFEPKWKGKRGPARPTAARAASEHAREIGWMPQGHFAKEARRAVREAILAPLAVHGIELSKAEVGALLGHATNDLEASLQPEPMPPSS